jgi:hypothetical protein
MNKSTLNALAFCLGLACMGLLVWVRHADESAVSVQRSARSAPPAAATPTPLDASATPLDAETRALLEELERLLLTGNARPKEAVLAFKDDEALRRFRARAREAGFTIVGDLSALNTVRVRYEDLKALQRELAQHAADYEAVAANYLVNLPRAPTKEERAAVDQVPFGNRTLSYIGADDPNRAGNWGRGTTIAILDSGVAADPTFGSGRIRYLDIGYGTLPGNGREDGHGTSVASLAAGLSPDAAGVAPAASLLSIRVTDKDGASDIFTLAQAIVAAVDSGAKILNVSLGGYATNALLNKAIGYAGDRGAIIVAAAGNDQAAQLAWPAADSRVISVGAVDAADQQVSFSNSGAGLSLSAPGYGVQTAWLNGWRANVDGTSASAPLVSGAIAAVISQNPSLTPQQAASLLLRTANDAGAPGDDPAFGNGILNLAWAMNSSTPGYVDTAISSHYFDPITNTVEVVVQNRSAQAVAGLNLNVASGATLNTYNIPSLAPGASQVVRVPVDTTTLKNAGQVSFSTQLVNPAGVNDRLPANNRKASVIAAPGH